MELQTILVPIDFSEHSASALDAAVDLAKAFGAKLELVHCYPPASTFVAPYGGAIPVDLEREVRESAGRQLSEWVGKASAAGVEANATVTPAPPVSGVIERAEAVDADLIVMGTRGLSGLKHVLLGSVAERTIRLAPCPVLTLKNDD